MQKLARFCIKHVKLVPRLAPLVFNLNLLIRDMMLENGPPVTFQRVTESFAVLKRLYSWNSQQDIAECYVQITVSSEIILEFA